MFLFGCNIRFTTFSDFVEEHKRRFPNKQRGVTFGVGRGEVFGEISESLSKRRRSNGGEEFPHGVAETGDRLSPQ